MSLPYVAVLFTSAQSAFLKNLETRKRGQWGGRRKRKERNEERRESVITAMARVLGPQAEKLQYGKLVSFLDHTVITLITVLVK